MAKVLTGLLCVPSLLFCVLTSALPPKKNIFVDRDTSTFRDINNHTLLWHGFNMVEKSPPFYPVVTEDTVADVKAYGGNVVRLGVMMGGMFPSASGEVNKTYMSEIDKIVDTLWQGGIWTILDLHQDVISPVVCGEGAPSWMIDMNTLGAKPLPQPLNKSAPTGSCAPTGALKFIGWSELYLTDACGKVFQNIYQGNSTIAQMFEKYWATVSARFKGRAGVLAYELMNEPWPGDIYTHPDILLESGKAETEFLGPWMQRMHSIVRSNDPDTHTLFAPAEVNNRLMRHVGYQEGFLPGEPMAFHTYCVVGTDGSGPTTAFTKELCHVNDGLQLTNRGEDLHRLKTAGFVTEFGGVSDTSTGVAEIRYVANKLDSVSPPLSWTFWTFGSVKDNGDDYKKELTRSYPRVTAGTLLSLSFDPVSAKTIVTFEPLRSGGDTELFLSKKYHYQNGWVVDVSPNDCCTSRDANDGSGVVVSSKVGMKGNIVITITAK